MNEAARDSLAVDTSTLLGYRRRWRVLFRDFRLSLLSRYYKNREMGCTRGR